METNFDVARNNPQERSMSEDEVRDLFNHLVSLYGNGIKSRALEIVDVLVNHFGMKGDNTISHFDHGASKLSNILGMPTDDVKIDIGPYFQKKGMRIEEAIVNPEGDLDDFDMPQLVKQVNTPNGTDIYFSDNVYFKIKRDDKDKNNLHLLDTNLFIRKPNATGDDIEYYLEAIDDDKIPLFNENDEVNEIKRLKGKKIKKKTITEVINDVATSEIDVENLKKKDELCPKVWDGDKMNPDVRKALLKNVLAFIKFLEMEDVNFKDITLTGSLANYNWTEYSDLDVHLILDFDQVGEDSEFLDDYFRTKKSLWNERMPIKVKGHDVEMYVQNDNEPHTSTGIYSIANDNWVTKPIEDMIGIDFGNVKSKAKHIADMIDDIEDYEDDGEKADIIDKFMEKLKLFRKAGLEDGGEFSTENLVFKGLRHSGYLDKLMEMKKESITNELTLETVSMYTAGTHGDVMENNIQDKK